MGLFKRSPKEPLATEAELASLRQQVDDLTSQLQDIVKRDSESHRTAQDVATRIGAVEARITQVGAEIANQLGELSGDIEGLDRRTSALAEGIGSLPEDVEILRHDQEELAREQARYQIAFRQDLADAIEVLQRKRT